MSWIIGTVIYLGIVWCVWALCALGGRVDDRMNASLGSTHPGEDEKGN